MDKIKRPTNDDRNMVLRHQLKAWQQWQFSIYM